jgi:hypothetical protein
MPWLIKKFVDKDAEFVFVPGEKVMAEAKRLDAIPYDVNGPGGSFRSPSPTARGHLSQEQVAMRRVI